MSVPVQRALLLAAGSCAVAALAGFVGDSNLVLVHRWLDHPWILALAALLLAGVAVGRRKSATWLSRLWAGGLVSLVFVVGGFFALLGAMDHPRTTLVSAARGDRVEAVVIRSGFKVEWESITIRQKHRVLARQHRILCDLWEVRRIRWSDAEHLTAEVSGDDSGLRWDRLRVVVDPESGRATVNPKDQHLCIAWTEGGS